MTKNRQDEVVCSLDDCRDQISSGLYKLYTILISNHMDVDITPINKMRAILDSDIDDLIELVNQKTKSSV